MAVDFVEIVDQLTPDIQVETNWSTGAAGLPNDNKSLLLMGQQLAAGSLTVPTGAVTQAVRRMTSTAQAISLYGKGSDLAVMVEAALKASPRAKIYAVAFKTGTTPVAASGTVTLATNASANGEVKVWVMGEHAQLGEVIFWLFLAAWGKALAIGVVGFLPVLMLLRALRGCQERTGSSFIGRSRENENVPRLLMAGRASVGEGRHW